LTRRDLDATLVQIRYAALGLAIGGFIAFFGLEISHWFGWPFGNIGWQDTASYVLMAGMAVWLICRFAGDR
jgi:hypothetical protein